VAVHIPAAASKPVQAVPEEADVAVVVLVVDSIPVEVVEHAVAEGMAVVAGKVVVAELEVDAIVVVVDAHRDERIGVAEHQAGVVAILGVDRLPRVVVFAADEGNSDRVLAVDAGTLDPVEVSMIDLVAA